MILGAFETFQTLETFIYDHGVEFEFFIVGIPLT